MTAASDQQEFGTGLRAQIKGRHASDLDALAVSLAGREAEVERRERAVETLAAEREERAQGLEALAGELAGREAAVEKRERAIETLAAEREEGAHERLRELEMRAKSAGRELGTRERKLAARE